MQILSSGWLAAPAATPDKRLIAAIGDPHGMTGHLDALLAAIESAAETLGQDREIVFMGDYIDRGPDPLGAIDRVMRTPRSVALMGNHDDWLVDLIEDRLSDERAGDWMQNGGLKTLDRMGVARDTLAGGVATLAPAVRQALGPERIAFLRGLRMHTRIGPYLFVHAGIDPRKRLRDQKREDLLWIREPFLSAQTWLYRDLVVVHGHTPKTAEVCRHRIGTDTGGFKSGVLTAALLHDNRVRFICAVGDTAKRPWNPERLPTGVRVSA